MNFSSAASRWLDPLITRRDGVIFDLLLALSLIVYVIGFLAIRRATTHAFALVVVLAVIYLVRKRDRLKGMVDIPGVKFLLVALAALFLAGLTSMLVRGRVEPPDLDGPSRFLLAGLVLLLFLDKGIRFVNIFARVASVALILALLAAVFNPEVGSRWGGRFATPSVDPNTLGSYAVILSFMVLLTLGEERQGGRWGRALEYAGITAGATLATLAASRGGWVAVGPLLLLWCLFRWRKGLLSMARQLILALGVVLAGVVLIPSVGERALGTGNEVKAWFDGTNTETASGQRLSIYKLAAKLIAERPLAGYGSKGVAEYLASPEAARLASPTIERVLIDGGPHSDFLGTLLGSGLPGAVSYILLVFGPMWFFWRHRQAPGEAALAAELGVCLTVGVFFCGLTNEMLSLKYLASFYGLTVAALAAQVLFAVPRPVASAR